jgi:hypothetical protein
VPDQNDDRRKGAAALFPWLVTAATVAVLAIALLTAGGSSDAASTEADLGRDATTTQETVVAPDADDTATAPATSGDDGSATAAIPEEVASDPVVKRLARGRDLPFTAGPWRRAQWRDAVYERLRPATRERAEKVAQGGGFGILIR